MSNRRIYYGIKYAHRGGGYHDKSLKHFGGVRFETHRGKDAKRHSLLRNILISPLEGEKKFLCELNELRNFREGYSFKQSCWNSNYDLPKQQRCIPLKRKVEAGFEPSPEFLSSPRLTKKFNPLTKREGSDSVITDNLINMNHSFFLDTVFSRFTSHFSRKRTAFTLAEVLITLGIIGIVAAITLPTIINNYRVKVLENQFKKADSIIQQAVQKTANEYGYTSLAELNVAGCATCDNNENYRLLKQQIPEINDIWYKQFKTVKIFSDSEAYWKNIYCNSFFGAKLNGTTYSCLYSGRPYEYMILADGMTVSPLFAYLGGFNHPVLIEAVFDTNGPYKGPNRLGYDIFRYETMNYNTMCNPNIVNSENFKGCYHWAHRNVSPLDSSKSYWSVLYKPLSYWKK